MLTNKSATAGEIAQMVKLLKDKKVIELDYSYDSEDDVGFISCYIGRVWIQYQDRWQRDSDIRTPMFLSFQMDRDSYNVSYPEGELYELLQKITKNAKELRGIGKTFSEKLKHFL